MKTEFKLPTYLRKGEGNLKQTHLAFSPKERKCSLPTSLRAATENNAQMLITMVRANKISDHSHMGVSPMLL